MKKVIISILIILMVLLVGCTTNLNQETEQVMTSKEKVSGISGCENYNNENVQNIKFDFWDINTNNKIEKCLETSKEIKFYDITNDDFIQKNPSVSENYVVWEDYKNGKSDIYLYNTATQEIKRITDNEGEDFRPIIRKNFVLYHDQYDEDPKNSIPDEPENNEYWRNDIWLYDVNEDDYTQLTYLHFQPITHTGYKIGAVDKNAFNGEYFIAPNGIIFDVQDKVNQDPNRLVTIKHSNDDYRKEKLSEVDSLNHFRKRNVDPNSDIWGGLFIFEDPTPPKIYTRCVGKNCRPQEENDYSVDCVYTGDLCKEDVPTLSLGNTIQNNYLIGGSTILNIKTGDYHLEVPPYKQVSGIYALEYNLKWGLEDLAYIDLNKKPIFYDQPVPNEISSPFDIDYNLFSVCLEKDYNYCTKQRNYLRIYDFKKGKYYTIKGSLSRMNSDEGDGLIEEGDFKINKEFITEPIKDEDIFDIQGNKIVWTNNNEKVINGISNKNTDIKLAVIT
ncbi:hypothetical protein J4228_03880 [Candidatus Woesearchaeota archaeon]|nr:hypothetical protein [Candidatus Woesearchaeota archaeon]